MTLNRKNKERNTESEGEGQDAAAEGAERPAHPLPLTGLYFW